RAVLRALVQLVVGPDGVRLIWTIEAALGLVDVGGGHGVAYVVEREAIAREQRGVDLDAHRGLLTAGQRDETNPAQLADLLHEARVREVLHGGQRQRVRRERERQHRRVGRVHLAVHGRVRQVLGEERRGGVDGGLHLLFGNVERQRKVELQRDHAR